MTDVKSLLPAKQKTWLAAGAGWLVFALLVWRLTAKIKLQGSDLLVLRVGLLVLGLVAAGLIVWMLHRRAGPAAPAAARDDIDVTAAAARSRLAASRPAGHATLSALPMIVVVGPEGSAKTTAVIRSGLNAELLAGGVLQDETVAPTPGINVWYASGTAVLEAGGPALAQSSRFARVVRHVRPARWRAALGRGEQPPRQVVACVSCEEFLKPGAGESAMAVARAMRERLAQLARGLGVRLPVYVLFTKADRIPCFNDYFQNLSNDEAAQLLGATLAGEEEAPGQYADREAARLGAAFQHLFLSLAEKRLQLLARENAAERKPGAYEFPREFRKVAPLAQQFLIELCRPSQLQVSPFLRGFYFTGVRAVYVTDAAQAAPLAARERGAVGATSVFGAQAQAQAAAAQAPTTRKVPQWLFLTPVFRDVVLADRAARQVTSGGTRVNLVRRVLLGGAAAAGVLLSIGVIVSWLGNRELAQGAARAAGQLAGVATPGQDLPTLDALQRLDSLRARIVPIEGYVRDGAPLGLRFGLFSGAHILPDARRAYFAAFDRLMFHDTRQAMTSTLAGLPAAPRPTDDYGATYSLLKAYLITTKYPEKSTVDFLPPVLMGSWLGGRTLDSARAPVAQRQFAFYAAELARGNPYDVQPDQGTVAHARTFLNQFAGSERIYQNMLSKAGEQHPAVQFNRAFPGSAEYVVDGYSVPGAFTKGGYAFMQGAFRNADQYFQGETWVVGDAAAGQVDKAKVLAELRTRYDADFVKAWRAYLEAASVGRYGSIKDASRRLGALSGPQSPLLALLSLASRNTAVDTLVIGGTMQPTQVVTPPRDTAKLIGASNQDYMSALAQLQASLDQVAAAPPSGADALISQASGNVSNAKLAAQKISQQFKVVGDGAVSAQVLRLLTAPIANVEPFLRNFGSGEMNGKGGSFCAQNGALFGKFPFDPGSSVQATPQEVATVLKPVTGALWTYYNEALANVLQQQGTEYAAKPGGTMSVSPAFLAFFNKAARASNALFPAGASEPQFGFVARAALTQGVSTATFAVDGDNWESPTGGRHTFHWAAGSAGQAQVGGGTPSGNKVVIQSYQGPWAIFQLFAHADRWATLGNTTTVEWGSVGGGEMRVGFDFDDATFPAVLRRGFFSGFRCVARVVQ